MKTIAILFSLFLLSLSSFAQQTDKELLSKYTAEEISILKTEHPEEYKYLTYCVTNAFYIAQKPEEKIKASPASFGNISIADLDNINFYDLGITIKDTEHQSFVIEGTDKLLIVKSKEHILSELNKK